MFLQFSKLDTCYKTKSEKYYYAKPWAYGVCATTTNFMYKICEFIKKFRQMAVSIQRIYYLYIAK